MDLNINGRVRVFTQRRVDHLSGGEPLPEPVPQRGIPGRLRND